MTQDLNLYKPIMLALSNDGRISVWHMAIAWAVIQLSKGDDLNFPVYVSRRAVMHLSHISSISTYHKCLKELQDFGFMVYQPSFHPGIRSRIFLKLP